MPVQDAEAGAGADLPEPRSRITRGSGKEQAVGGRDGKAVDIAGMPLQDAQAGASASIPKPDGRVHGSGGEKRTARAETAGKDPAPVASQGAETGVFRP